MDFGSTLKEIRLAKHMSQQELANLLGTSKQVISRYETGQRVPRLSVAKHYAEVLGVSLPALVGDDAETVADGAIREKMFSELLELCRLSETVDEDANVTIYGIGFQVNKTPELVDEIMRGMQDYFSYQLRIRGTQ